MTNQLFLTNPSTPTLAVALDYARRGWALIPLEPGNKEPFFPLLPKDERGKATWKPLTVHPATEAQIRGWFSQEPDINIGILTGRPSGGLIVLDCDQELPLGLHLPSTVRVTTGRNPDAFHAYFSHPSRIKKQQFSWGDLIAEGGYVVAPPSKHPNGVRYYEWVPWCSPSEIEIAKIPRDLLGRIQDSKVPQTKRRLGARKRINTLTRSQKPSRSWPFRGLAKDPDVACSILRKCGAEVQEIGEMFHYPLPGHEEANPSAKLWMGDKDPDPIIAMWDFHLQVDGKPLCWHLGDVYCACRYNMKAELLKGGTRAIWWLRALMETGFVAAPEVPHLELPEAAPKGVRRLYGGFVLLLRTRELYRPDQIEEGAPFSYRFASDWSGLRSQRAVSEAMKWLLRHGFLQIRSSPGHSGKRSKCVSTMFTLGGMRNT